MAGKGDRWSAASIVDAGVLAGLLGVAALIAAIRGLWMLLDDVRWSREPVDPDAPPPPPSPPPSPDLLEPPPPPADVLLEPERMSPLGMQFWFEDQDLPWNLRLLSEAGPAVGLLTWAVALLLVALVIRDIGRGRSFDPAVPKRITALAGVVVAGEVLSTVLRWWASEAVVSYVESRTDTVGPVLELYPFIPVYSLFIAAFVLVIAQAFRQGRKLATEVEGLV